MFYEVQYRQLVRLRAAYWQMESASLRNLKLGQMILCADACGKDLLEFLLEEKSEDVEAKAPEKVEIKAKVSDRQVFIKAKSNLHLQRKSKTHLQKAPAFAQKFKCPFCDFTTDSSKSLSGHQKRHSSKYQSLNMAV